MIDAKRLAELMTPAMLGALAEYMEKWSARLKPREAESGMHDHMLRSDEDALDCAAAVLRAVARETGWLFLDMLKETPRKTGERFTEWHNRCRAKVLRARIAATEAKATEVAATAPDPAEIASLVEIGRRVFQPGATGADPACMAIHDAASNDATARAAYSELMSVLAAEKRKP